MHDWSKPLPVPDGSVEAVYASHLLHHFAGKEGQALLQECRRMLRLGGILRVVTADLRAPLEGALDDLATIEGQNPSALALIAEGRKHALGP